MTAYVLPVLFVLLAWWGSTGVVFWLDGLPRRTFQWSMLGATLLLAVAVLGLMALRDDTSVRGAGRASSRPCRPCCGTRSPFSSRRSSWWS